MESERSGNNRRTQNHRESLSVKMFSLRRYPILLSNILPARTPFPRWVSHKGTRQVLSWWVQSPKRWGNSACVEQWLVLASTLAVADRRCCRCWELPSLDGCLKIACRLLTRVAACLAKQRNQGPLHNLYRNIRQETTARYQPAPLWFRSLGSGGSGWLILFYRSNRGSKVKLYPNHFGPWPGSRK